MPSRPAWSVSQRRWRPRAPCPGDFVLTARADGMFGGGYGIDEANPPGLRVFEGAGRGCALCAGNRPIWTTSAGYLRGVRTCPVNALVSGASPNTDSRRFRPKPDVSAGSPSATVSRPGDPSR